MQEIPSSALPNPAVLRFQGLDLEAMAVIQLRNIQTMRRMANLIFDCNEAVTMRQIEFLKAEAAKFDPAWDPGEAMSDPKQTFARQTVVYSELLDRLSAEIAGLAEITSRCCSGLVREAASNMVEFPKGEATVERAASGPAAGPQAMKNTRSAQG